MHNKHHNDAHRAENIFIVAANDFSIHYTEKITRLVICLQSIFISIEYIVFIIFGIYLVLYGTNCGQRLTIRELFYDDKIKSASSSSSASADYSFTFVVIKVKLELIKDLCIQTWKNVKFL